jgi:hypothetical protein
MSKIGSDVRHPIAFGFAVYACVHVALFALIGLLGLPLPALWWALLSIPPGWLLVQWLDRHGYPQLGQLVGIYVVAFAGSVVGLHGRQLFCMALALV